MNCPKCGQQNPDYAQVCTSCNSQLTQPPEPAETVKVTTSGLAITAFAFTILAFLLLPFAVRLNIKLFAIIWILVALISIILGIIALVQIGLSAGKVVGKAFAATAVAIPILLYFVMCFYSALYRPRCVAYRMVCGSNLAQIGRAMLIYNSDYGDMPLPRAGGPGTIWQTKINDWRGRDRISAFNLKPDGTGGSATISSSFYLLVKYVEQDPKLFVCPWDTGTTEFKPAEYGALEKDIDKFWDFGPEPAKHYSYSYHIPYSQYVLLDTGDPGQAIAADRNPWLDPYTDTTGFKWNDQIKTGGSEDIKRYQKGNAGFHQREGQNVLFLDNHVYFEKQSFCGVNDDNIYTYWDGPHIQQGAPPVIGSQPADKIDSLLVNEPPLAANQK